MSTDLDLKSFRKLRNEKMDQLRSLRARGEYHLKQLKLKWTPNCDYANITILDSYLNQLYFITTQAKGEYGILSAINKAIDNVIEFGKFIPQWIELEEVNLLKRDYT